MTTGTITRDFTVATMQQTVAYDPYGNPTTVTNNGTAPTGSYWWKDWSGTNSPPKPWVYRDLWRPFLQKNGTVKYFKKRVREPRLRDKYRQDNNYRCDIISWREPRLYKITQVNPFTGYPLTSQTRSVRAVFGAYLPPTATSLWNANNDIALIGKLREKIAGSDFNMAVTLGEAGESVKMIFAAATKIRKALMALKKGNVGGAVRHLISDKSQRRPLNIKKTLGDNWLELQYGWLPLLKDVQGAAEFLAQHYEFPHIMEFRVRLRKAYSYQLPLQPIVAGNNYTCEGGTKAQLIAKLKERDVVKLSGLIDPASLVWELLPYSFVADWFIPIGNYLAARGLAQATTGTFVKTITTRNKYEVRNVDHGPSWLTEPDPDYSYLQIGVVRTVTSSLTVPLPNVKPLSEVLSWKRAANSIALLQNAFGSTPSDRWSDRSVRFRR
jgi:hypothetical protein